MKTITSSKIIVAAASLAIFAFFLGYRNYYQREIEDKVAAGTYMVALNSMRELMFFEEGIKNNSIKKGCFIHKRVEEILRDIDRCLVKKNYELCKDYAETVAPKDFIEKYQQVKANPRAFSGCD
jgi:hypothetical protein